MSGADKVPCQCCDCLVEMLAVWVGGWGGKMPLKRGSESKGISFKDPGLTVVSWLTLREVGSQR